MACSYVEIKEYVRKSIANGKFRPNQKLPADDGIAKQFNTSRLTVHRALRELATEGLIDRGPGRGSMVVDPRKSMVGTVAFLAPYFTSGHEEQLHSAIAEDLLEKGLGLVPYSCHTSPEREMQIARYLTMNPPQGVIISPCEFEESAEAIKLLKDAGIPVVIEGKYEFKDLNVSYVSMDNFQGGRIMAEHLLGLGHKKFAVISASRVLNAVERERGFCQAVHEAGCDIPTNCIFHVRHLSEIFYVVEELMGRTDRPTAIFGLNDIVAAETMASLRDQKFRVPEDCAVVGLGDDVMARALVSPLTTAAAPFEKQGHLITSMLLNSVQGNFGDNRKIELEYELVVRESCGAKLL
jgi:DNA-binding LacI/PurR family transcriptional regulator